MYRCIVALLIPGFTEAHVAATIAHVDAHGATTAHVDAHGAFASNGAAYAAADAATRMKLMRSRAEKPLLHLHKDVAGASQLEQSNRSSPAGTLDNATAPAEKAADDAAGWTAALMILVLILSLSGLVWMQRKRLQQGSRRELFANIAVILYVLLTVAVDILIRRSHQKGGHAYSFHPASLVLLIEVAKLVVSCIVAAIDLENTRKVAIKDFLRVMQLMMIPGVSYWLLNLGRYLALAGADLDEYRVWRATDIIFVAVFWFVLFRRVPRLQHILGIALVFLACLLLHPQAVMQTSFRLNWPMMVTVGLAFMSSFGLVTNELGLKASSETSIAVQNIALYVVTCVLNGAYLMANVPMREVFRGMDSTTWAIVILDAGLGLCVACVLKLADAMVKQLASGWLAPLEPLVGHFVVGTPVTPNMVTSTILAGAGSIIYRIDMDAWGKATHGISSSLEKS